MITYTVVVPAYNSASYLADAICSIIDNTLREDIEVLIIDDGSTDDTLLIAQNFASRDSRVKVLHQLNAGPGAARNLGLSVARGEYLVFLDSDDTLHPDFFVILQDRIIIAESPDIIFFNIRDVYPLDNKSQIQKLEKYNPLSIEKLLHYQLSGKVPWGAVRKVVKSSIIQSADATFSNHQVGEEALFTLRIMLHAKRMTHIPIPLYNYFHRNGTQSSLGGDDPWGPIHSHLREYVLSLPNLSQYLPTVNALGFHALFAEGARCFRKRRKEFTRKYCQHIKTKYNLSAYEIDRRSLIFPLSLLVVPVLSDKTGIILYTLLPIYEFFHNLKRTLI